MMKYLGLHLFFFCLTRRGNAITHAQMLLGSVGLAPNALYPLKPLLDLHQIP
ncbi:hypothetical protein WH47_05426 [Habropoda laboriosa]|uniref:Uncharacterized protein n=1 Tax=Habropoda laboriosa TaxID=597456 RepID=A0A0L7QJF5_9HYME|nr:hypothetical protein WH47_05426 [Habropoda laboriosa]